jgi:transcriptional regulator with XRE-family HTH domain
LESRLRKIRKERKLPGTEVAKRLNITSQYYYEIERGKKRMSAAMAARLAEMFGVTTDYLLGRSDVPDGYAAGAAAGGAADPADAPRTGLSGAGDDRTPAARPALSPKEMRDIAVDLERMIAELESGAALAFHGESMDEESKALLKISLENSMRLAKQLAKQKFTPRKYRS